MKLLVPLLVITAGPLAAQSAKPEVRFGAFIDTYFGYDAGRPDGRDRAFATQAVRHNEFNINLAHVEATVSGDRVRGRLALQAGTSVQSNYAGEPMIGANSGPALSRHIQEAVAGARIGDGVWIDAGIFFSHIGQESWISRDNPTYTRSFTAEYTPYYSSGVKVTWTASHAVTAQLHLINGWQNISETNSAKAVGARIDWTPSAQVTVGVSAFVGNEKPDGDVRRTRTFGQLFARIKGSDQLTVWATADVGAESGGGIERSTFGSGTLVAELAVSPRVSVAGRVERYIDRDGVLIGVAAPEGFDVTSGSIGLNVRLPDGLQWRTEARLFRSDGEVWPDRGSVSDNAALVVTSLAITL